MKIYAYKNFRNSLVFAVLVLYADNSQKKGFCFDKI